MDLKTWKRLGIVVAALLFAGLGWWWSDVLERDNDFCNACHLSVDAPLHIDIREDFDSRPPATLAGVHGFSTEVSRAASTAVRCIDCHGGVGPLGRTRVKLLAARDAFVWLSGDFEEPAEMKHPLRDADCRKCHTGVRQSGDSESQEKFHDLAVHNVDLGVDCVECHTVHKGGTSAALFFLDADLVRTQCGRCHVQFRR